MKRALKILTFLIIAWATTPAFAETVSIKHHNDGTTSCNNFCNHRYGGDPGICISAKRTDNGAYLGCGDSPGKLATGELQCGCISASVKGGNNGTANCNDWCSRPVPGPSGQCVLARRGDIDQELGCDQGSPIVMPPGKTFECYCHNPTDDNQALQDYKNQTQNAQATTAQSYGALQSQLGSLQVQQGQLNATLGATNQSIASTQPQVAAKQSDLATAQAQLASQTTVLTSAQADQAAAEAAAAAQQAAAASASTNLARLISQKTSTDAQLQTATQQQANLTAQLTTIGSDLSATTSALSAAAATATSGPSAAKTLLAQVGVLKGPNRTCSAFATSSHEILTAGHCIKGLAASEVSSMTYTDTNNSVRHVNGVSSQDLGHDSVVLSVDSSDGAFTANLADPIVNDAVRLLAWDTTSNSITLSDTCHILSIDLAVGTLMHDCASAPGMSGGALVQAGQVVAVHLGAMTANKLASLLNTSSLPAIPLLVLNAMSPEYDCNSDCRAQSYRRVCGPFGVGCTKVWDPTLFSACETGRSADCSAKAAEAAVNNAAASASQGLQDLGKATQQMVDSTVSIASQIPSIQSQVDQIQVSVDQLNRAVNAADTSLSSLNSQISDISTHVSQVVGQTVTVGNAIQAAKSAQTAANGLRDQAAASVVTINRQIAITSTNLASETQQIDVISTDVAEKGAQLVTAAAKDLSIHQAVAVSHSIVGITTDMANAGLDVGHDASVVSAAPIVEQMASKDTTSLDGLDTKIEKWSSKAMRSTVYAFKKVIAPKIKSALYQAYKKVLKKLAAMDPTTKDEKVYVGRVDVVRMCLTNASAAVASYKADLANLSLADFAANPGSINLSNLANAIEVIGNDLLNLNATLVEIQANRCDGSVGIDQPVYAAAADADLWNQWLLNKRVSLTSSN